MSACLLIDYGAGNLRSVAKALQAAGASVHLVSSPVELQQAAAAGAKLVLPGVGAFGDGMQGLQARGLVEPLKQAVEAGAPLLGICLGMQLFFEGSDETPGIPGLGLLPGWVRRFDFDGRSLKVPQTGWNQVWPVQDSPLFVGLPEGSYAYFNHGFYCDPAVSEAGTERREDHAQPNGRGARSGGRAEPPQAWLAATEYGFRYPSVVGRGRLYGVQFHPEKSQAVGLQMLRNFVEAG
jgi:imidazole glycerol-phosphate synthase subunit HisH